MSDYNNRNKKTQSQMNLIPMPSEEFNSGLGVAVTEKQVSTTAAKTDSQMVVRKNFTHRDMQKIEADLIKIATESGPAFLYIYVITTKVKSKVIEGVSIKGAMSIFNHFGNIEIDVKFVKFRDDFVLLKCTLFDLETNSKFSLLLPGKNPFKGLMSGGGEGESFGGYDVEKTAQMKLATLISKIERNAIVKYYGAGIDKLIAAAKGATTGQLIKRIETDGILAVIDKIITGFSEHGVQKDSVIQKFQLPPDLTKTTMEILVRMTVVLTQLTNGDTSVDEFYKGPKASATVSGASPVIQKAVELEAAKIVAKLTSENFKETPSADISKIKLHQQYQKFLAEFQNEIGVTLTDLEDAKSYDADMLSTMLSYLKAIIK